MSDGTLHLCATPIGNLGDVSQRLGDTLADVDVIYAEDTRRTRKLLAHLGIEKPLRSLFEGNEKERSSELVEAVASGANVALVSDAGTPGVSDPGSVAVRMALDAGLRVTVVPGPSAVTSAVALSGFAGDRFTFEGFLPRKGGSRSERLERIARDDRPTVLFVSPHRSGADLADLAAACGAERRILVARELTKLHEEVWSGPIGEAAQRFADAKGELTVVVEGGSTEATSLDEAVVEAGVLVGGGATLSEAARAVSRELGVSRRAIYEALLDQERS